MYYDPEDWCKIWRKTDLLFQIDMRNLTNFDLSTRNLKSFHFNGLLLSNAYIVWAKKVKKSYVSWHWRVMQNLKKNWYEVWKWHEEFDKFSPEHSKVSKLGLWWDPSAQSRKCMSRGVMYRDNEEWYKNWRRTDLPFQNWHEEFDEFWPEHSNV